MYTVHEEMLKTIIDEQEAQCVQQTQSKNLKTSGEGPNTSTQLKTIKLRPSISLAAIGHNIKLGLCAVGFDSSKKKTTSETLKRSKLLVKQQLTKYSRTSRNAFIQLFIQ